jgi:hypothetical protein
MPAVVCLVGQILVEVARSVHASVGPTQALLRGVLQSDFSLTKGTGRSLPIGDRSGQWCHILIFWINLLLIQYVVDVLPGGNQPIGAWGHVVTNRFM